MGEQLRPQTDVDAVRGVGEEIGAEPAEHRLKAAQSQHAEGQHVQRRDAFVDQDLVRHDLEKQGRQECKELQEERRQQDLPKELAIFENRR